MVRTRNQVARANLRGAGWTEQDEEHCYFMFFRLCERKDNIHDSAAFNEVFDELTRELSAACGKDFKVNKVKDKIQMLKTHFIDFCTFKELPGVEFDVFSNKVTVTEDYYSNLDYVESNLNRYYRNYGFPHYSECVHVFTKRNAAEIDFNGLPGYTRDNPLEITGSSSDEEDYDNIDEGGDEHIERIDEWEFEGLPGPVASDNETEGGSVVDST